jgi:hypothetical protein
MKISIAQAKKWREEINATHLVVFAVACDGSQYVATHGKTERNAKEAAKAGNNLKAAFGWPEHLCNDKALERICKNCTYYKPDYGIHCFNGWSGDGSSGYCMLQPIRVAKNQDDKCVNLEPNA